MHATRRMTAGGCLLALLLAASAAHGSYWFRASGVWTPAGPEPVQPTPQGNPVTPPPPETTPEPAVAAPSPAVPNVAPVARPDPAPEPRPAPPPVTRAPAPQPAAPPRVPAVVQLDLEQLEQRLRGTKAIGMFTKLELKGQVGDLVERFEAYHENEGALTLSQLERQFDLLMMKVLTLLQEDDKPLHREIAAARPALWSTLSDPARFAQYARS